MPLLLSDGTNRLLSDGTNRLLSDETDAITGVGSLAPVTASVSGIGTFKSASAGTGSLASASSSLSGIGTFVSAGGSSAGIGSLHPGIASLSGTGTFTVGSGGGGGGGSAFNTMATVTLIFNDPSSSPIPLVSFAIPGVGTGISGPLGSIDIALPISVSPYTLLAAPTGTFIFSPLSFTVSADMTLVITAIASGAQASADRTASYLVDLVRDILGARGGNNPYRSGFATDAMFGEDSISILTALNTTQRDLSETGYFKCYFSFQMTIADTNGRNDEYALDRRIHRIRDVVLTDTDGKKYPLKMASRGELDNIRGSWRNYTSSRPQSFWVDGNIIGFDFPADKAYTITMLAETVAPDLLSETDIPSQLPSRFQEMLAYGAAMKLLSPQIIKDAQAEHLYVRLEEKYNYVYTELTQVSRSKPMQAVQALQPRRGR